MATINIEGRKVTVGDSFLQMSPDEQNDAVDEIAQSIGVGASDNQEINQRIGIAHDAGDPNRQLQEAKQAPHNPGVAPGLMMGFDDEIGAAMMSPIEATKNYFQGDGFDIGKAYTDLQQKNDANKTAYREQNPVKSTLQDIAGGLVTGGGLAKSGVTLAGRLGNTVKGRVAAGVLEGGIYGGVVGAGESNPGERVDGAIDGVKIGGVTGGLLSTAGVAISRSKILKEIIPKVSDLKTASQSLYTEMEKSGIKIRPRSFDMLVAKMGRAAGRLHENLHPKSIGALEILKREGGKEVSLSELDDVRRVLSRAAQKGEPDDVRILSKMIGEIDGFVDKLSRVHATGDMKGTKLIKEARSLWAKKSKSEIVEDIMEKARNQATGFENGMRVQFRALANNKKKFRNFTKGEQDAIIRIVRGGPLENILRTVGWLSPTGIFGALTTGAVGTGTGILPAAAMASLGYSARKGAEAVTRANVGKLDRVIKIGNSQIALPKIDSKLAPLQTITSQEGSRLQAIRRSLQAR